MPSIYLLIEHYGYFLLFLVLLGGIIGIPVPDEGVLLFSGALIAKGHLSFIPVFMCSVLAILTGSIINYRIALQVGKWRLARWGKRVGLPVRTWKKSVRMFRKNGLWTIPISYFIPGVRMGVSYGAGLMCLGMRPYILLTLIGVIGWVGVYLGLGYGLAVTV